MNFEELFPTGHGVCAQLNCTQLHKQASYRPRSLEPSIEPSTERIDVSLAGPRRQNTTQSERAERAELNDMIGFNHNLVPFLIIPMHLYQALGQAADQSNGRDCTGVPHTVPSGATVHGAFPPFPKPKKKRASGMK